MAVPFGKRSGQTEIHAGPREGLERRAADPGRNAGELPASGDRVQQGIAFDVREQPAVADVQHVAAIVTEHAVGGIADVSRRLRRWPCPPPRMPSAFDQVYAAV